MAHLGASGLGGQAASVAWFLVQPLGVMFVAGIVLAGSCLARLAGVPAPRIRRVLMTAGITVLILFTLFHVVAFVVAVWFWRSWTF